MGREHAIDLDLLLRYVLLPLDFSELLCLSRPLPSFISESQRLLSLLFL